MQQEVELSKQRHEGDLKEKERLVRMMGNKVIFNNFFASCLFLGHYRRQNVFSILLFIANFFLEDITGYDVWRPFLDYEKLSLDIKLVELSIII